MRGILTILVLISLIARGQNINQFDENGKKHGSWSAYVDSSLCSVDSVNSIFHGFSEFVHGKNIFQFNCSKWKKNLRVNHSKNTSQGKILNGVVEFYNEKNAIVEIHKYKNGHASFYKTYNYSSEDSYYWTESYFFDSLYNGIPGTYYYESENNEGVQVSTGWFRNGVKGWKVYETDEFEDIYFVAGDSTLGVFVASETDYKYPYYGHNIPRYIAVVMGYDGIQYGTIESGLAVNISDTYVARKTGSMIGASILFRYNHLFFNTDSVGVNYLDTAGLIQTNYWAPDTSYWGMAFEIGNYSLITFGMGYNFNTDGHSTTHGFRPFVGTTLYNFQALLSYNFYSNKKNRIGRLVHTRLTLRYAIPIPRKKYANKKE